MAKPIPYDKNPPTRSREPKWDKFTSSYFETALWSSTDNSDDSGGEPLDANYSVSDIAEDTKVKMMADCADFQDRYAELLGASGISTEREGHNFWLSRNGHGAGFFDDDLDELQEAAKSYGEFDLYVGDDGEIHGSPLESRPKTREARRGVVRSPHHVAAVPQHPLPLGTKVRLRDNPDMHGTGKITGIDRKGQTYEVKFGDDFYEYPFGLVDPVSGGYLNEGGHRVADFNTLDDLVNHAHRELGATHVSGEDANTKIYFPRGGQHQYEEATVWRKGGYWHAQGPGARTGVAKLPAGATSLGRGQRAAESGRHGQAQRDEDRERSLDRLYGHTRGRDPYPFPSDRDRGISKLYGPKSGASGAPTLMKPGSNRVRDYAVVDRQDRTVAGPFKSYQDARDAAGGAGAVKFVPTKTREARRSSHHKIGLRKTRR